MQADFNKEQYQPISEKLYTESLSSKDIDAPDSSSIISNDFEKKTKPRSDKDKKVHCLCVNRLNQQTGFFPLAEQKKNWSKAPTLLAFFNDPKVFEKYVKSQAKMVEETIQRERAETHYEQEERVKEENLKKSKKEDIEHQLKRSLFQTGI